MNPFINLKHRFAEELRHDANVWLTVLLATSLVLIPNLVACFIPSFIWLSLQLWGFSVALLLLPCLFGVRVKILLWLAFPLVLLAPACVACLLTINNLPTTFLFLALLETNRTEFSAFQTQTVIVAGAMLLFAALYAWFVKVRVPGDFRFGMLGRGIIVGVLIVPSLWDLAAVGPVYCIAKAKQNCLSTFPCSTFYGAYEAYDMRLRVRNRKDLGNSLVVEQEKAFRDESRRQVHMLVIGESAARSCFGLYGYERETTPLLERTEGLLPFQDVTCAATVTLAAVPALVTPTKAGNILEATRRPSLLSAYQKAGYRVYWFSAQRKHGTFDTLTSLYSEDADEAEFPGGSFDRYGSGGYTGISDMKLLPLVRDVLQRGEPKVLIVLHTIGSHGPYPARYSQKQARFPADTREVVGAMSRVATGASLSARDLQLMQNSYDNTICVTDTLLANLIHELKGADASSWFYYVSDHGENTSRALTGKFMHGMVTREVVEVPLLMWLSPAYEQAHASRADALKSHLGTPFSATCTFHTVLDLAGLSCPDFKPELSCASARFNPGRRAVCDSNGRVVDYDLLFPPLKSAARGAKETRQATAENIPPP